jgi:hypothetical protein
MLLSLPEAVCSNDDAVILMSSLVGHKVKQHIQPDGVISHRLLADLMKAPDLRRNRKGLNGVVARYDRSKILENPFRASNGADLPFSDFFQAHLKKERQHKMREYFYRLHKSVNRLNAAVILLASLIKDPYASKAQIRACTKEVRMSIQSCEFHLKSGIAMALANNVHPHAIWKATHGLYELRASRMKTLFEKVDQVLLKRDIHSSLGMIMARRNATWGKNWRDIFESHKVNRNNNNGIGSLGITGFR